MHAPGNAFLAQFGYPRGMSSSRVIRFLPALTLPALLALACSSDPDVVVDTDAGTGGTGAETPAAGGDTVGETPAADATRKDGATASSALDAAVTAEKSTSTGVACSVAADCTGTGEAQCVVTSQGYTFPGGYCTAICANDSECGDGARCPLAPALSNPLLTVFAGALAPQIRMMSYCLQTCEGEADCRSAAGYRCAGPSEIFPGAAQLGVDVSQRYCIPPTTRTPAADAGTPLDAGAQDGGAPDAGNNAATPDGGPIDAGVDAEVDAGATPDAGDAVDASTGLDAGPALDASAGDAG
jgi:hypothetical protein